MGRGGKSKVKILYLLKILQEETDAERGLTMSGIIEKLAENGVNAERKSIYSDLEALREFGVDVVTYPRNPVEYAIAHRGFTLSELMLIVDAIQSCRAITDKQARMLITNVKTLASTREQEKLDRRIHVVGRVKSKSDSVLGTVDSVHDAMRLSCKIAFSYGRLGPDGKRHYTNHGKKHVVSPMGITYDDGLYYLTAWDDVHEGVVEYRLDRMGRVYVLEREPAVRNEVVSGYRFESRKSAVFGRFAGEEVTVTFAVAPEKVEIVTDRFGDAATFVGGGKDEVRAYARVCKSEQFFGWVAGMGGVVRIVSPKSLLEEYRAYLQSLLER